MGHKRIARIVDEVNGYGISDDALPHIDTGWERWSSRRAAITHLRDSNHEPEAYTHYLAPSGQVIKL